MSDAAQSDFDPTAAEYVLGVLDVAERGAVAARLDHDPAFAAEVDWWTERLGALAETIAPAAPPLALWDRIEAELGEAAPRLVAIAANDDQARVRFWRRWAMAASGLAAASLVGLAVMSARPPVVVQVPVPTPVSAPPVVATLKSKGGAVALVAAYDAGAGALVLAPVGAAPDKTVPTLWLLQPGGGVRRVGPMDMTKPSEIKIDAQTARTARGALGLAVSLEPAGVVSSTPKGPVIASGAFAKV
jgi:anti-sigma-K factor RskA